MIHPIKAHLDFKPAGAGRRNALLYCLIIAMLKIINVVGARPNFMKIAPVIDEMRRRSGRLNPLLVHTGQHYDEAMSESFFTDLGLPRPDINLEIGSDSHAAQTARIMMAFEQVMLDHRPDW